MFPFDIWAYEFIYGLQVCKTNTIIEQNGDNTTKLVCLCHCSTYSRILTAKVACKTHSGDTVLWPAPAVSMIRVYSIGPTVNFRIYSL